MKRIISILFMVVTGLVCCVDVNAQQLPDGYKKFLGVWNCEPPIGGFGNIKGNRVGWQTCGSYKVRSRNENL